MGGDGENNGVMKLKNVAGATTFGSLAGFCSGLFAKKAGQAAALTFGGLFTLFQLAAWTGYITVNWKKVEKDTTRLLDFNKDGKLDEADAHFALENTVGVLSNNMGASGAGFAAGFFLGLKR